MKTLRAWLSQKPIYQQLSALVFATVVSLCLFLILAFTKVFSMINQQWIDHACELAVQLESTVQARFNSYSKIAHLAAYNSTVQAFLLSENEADQYSLYSEMRRNLSDFSNLDAEILDIIIEDQHGQKYRLSDSIVYSIPDLNEEELSVCVSPLLSIQVLGEKYYYQVLSKNIYSIDSYVQTNKLIGTVHLILSPSAFVGDESTVYPPESGNLYVTDSGHNIIWSNTGTFSTFLPASHSTIYWQIHRVGSTGLSVALFLWPKNISFTDFDARDIFIVAAILFLVVLLVLWVVWVQYLVRPLHVLSSFLEKTSQKKLDILSCRVELNGYREIHSIGYEINNMLSTIDDLTKELMQKKSDLYESRLLAKQAELSHLRSQINPHFLYNTLETMVGIAYTESQPRIAELARALSLIFKYSIKGSAIVPLKNELKIAKNYILIQKARFEDRFDDEYIINSECLQDQVPKMILQPLIENAIVHGIEPCSRFCHLTISAQHMDGDLVICVSDDGAGIPPEQLEKLNEQLLQSCAESNQHIGVGNVHHRIRLMYGTLYGIRLESTPGEGSRVTIRLPVLPV